ncbi:acyl carrier protein [Streptomyces sp. NPDC057702]|uniref:acyl carrier protein n=1 Tax=unclassified Streptomyces TaxID=2593676 RepID=UPI0036C81ECE
MTTTPFTERLRGLPDAERRARIAELAQEEFRAALFMEPGEEVPLDGNYFDLGLSSLRLADIRQRLEEELGHTVETAALFASPTLGHLVDHLARAVSPAPPDPATAPAPDDHDSTAPAPAASPPADATGPGDSAAPRDAATPAASRTRQALVADLLDDLYRP